MVHNKGSSKKDKKEELLKILKNIEVKNGEQLKAIKDQGEYQIKMIGQNKIKAPRLKGIYNKEVQKGSSGNDETRRIFKVLEDLEGKEIGYSKMVYEPGDSVYFDFSKYGPLSSFCLKLIEGCTSLKNAKLILREFNVEMDRLKRKKTKKRSCKKNKENVLKNAEMLFKIVIKAFEDYVFMNPYRPDNRPDHELTDTDQNDSDQNENDCDLEFYTPKEVTTRDEISDFEIKGMFENEDEITPGDMPDLESDESAKE